MGKQRTKFEDQFIVTKGWMISKLELKGNELTAFALVWGFSQDGENEFTGSISTVMKWLNSTRPTAINVMKSLVKKELFVKNQVTYNNVTFNKYHPNFDKIEYLRNLTGSKEILPPLVKKFDGGSKEILPPLVKKFDGGSKEILLGGSKEILPNNIVSNNTNTIFKKDSDLFSSGKDNRKQVKDAISCMELLNDLTGVNRSFAEVGRGSDNVKYLVALLKTYSKEEIETMILYKVWEWKGTKMEKHLKPVTLFKNHGKEYVEDALIAKDSPAFKAALKKAKEAETGRKLTGGHITRNAIDSLANW